MAAALPGQEPRQRLAEGQGLPPKTVALTLDACGGAYDQALIHTLIALQVPATLFVTAGWLRAHPEGLQQLLAHPGLFELENHGAEHRPALVGQTLYGMHGPAELAGVAQEIAGGAAEGLADALPALLNDGWHFARLSQGSGSPLAVVPVAPASANAAGQRLPASAPPHRTPSR